MHQSSYENMKKFVQSNFKNLDSKNKSRVLDVGSLDVNGTYRNLFNNDFWIYEGLDMEHGENVDFVPKEPYDWKELKSNTYDLVISGQALEHIEYPWKTFENIERVLKPSALCCIIAPSSGPKHKHPVDCWRFYPDGMKALCKHANLETLSCSIIEQKTEDNSFELWKDIVLVARKKKPSTNSNKTRKFEPITKVKSRLPVNFAPRYESAVTSWHPHRALAFELIKKHKPREIVELGVHYGDSYFTFCQACEELELDTQLYGIDHWQGDEQAGLYGEEVFETVSSYNEEFYPGKSTLLRMDFEEALQRFEDGSVDLLHIDGRHEYESVKKDFENWLPKLKKGGLILIHDILVEREDYGVKKFWEELNKNFFTKIQSEAHGLGVVLIPFDNIEKKSSKIKPDDLLYRNFKNIIKNKTGNLLEVGSRSVCPDSNVRKIDLLENNQLNYTGCDIVSGENVDIVCDAHKLSHHFAHGYFDVVVSNVVFEHLIFPWKVILEINSIMKVGGLLWIWTHPNWPQHELPWDYWRFQKNSFYGLLNEYTGFEIKQVEESYPASIQPKSDLFKGNGISSQVANLGVGVIAEKIGNFQDGLSWDIDIGKIKKIPKQDH